MADPFSIITGVFSLSQITVKLITSLSNYVDEVENAREDIQALHSEVCSTRILLTELRLAVNQRDHEDQRAEFKKEGQRVIEHCKKTLESLQELAQKGMKIETTRGLDRMVKTIKWTFQKEEVERLRKFLQHDKDNLSLMLQVLNNQKNDESLSLLKKISSRIDDLENNRQGVKETFAVVSRGDPRGSLTILDHRGQVLSKLDPAAQNARNGFKRPRIREMFSDKDWRVLGTMKDGERRAMRCLELFAGEGRPLMILRSGNDSKISLMLRRSSSTKLVFDLFGDAVKQIDQQRRQLLGEEGLVTRTLTAINLSSGGSRIGPFITTFWKVKLGTDKRTVFLYPTAIDQAKHSLTKIAVAFHGAKEAAWFMNRFHLVRREQVYFWEGLASMHSHLTGLDAHNDQQMMEDAMKREMKSRDE